MITDFGWETLLQRRTQAKLVMMYRITYSLIDSQAPQLLHLPTLNTRGHSMCFLVPYCGIHAYRSFHCGCLWNQLLESIVTVPTLETKGVMSDRGMGVGGGGARKLGPLIHIKYRSSSPGQGVCWVRMSRRNTMQGLKVLPIIVDEIARVNEIVVGRTNWQKTGGLCHTMPAGATKREKF